MLIACNALKKYAHTHTHRREKNYLPIYLTHDFLNKLTAILISF